MRFIFVYLFLLLGTFSCLAQNLPLVISGSYDSLYKYNIDSYPYDIEPFKFRGNRYENFASHTNTISNYENGLWYYGYQDSIFNDKHNLVYVFDSISSKQGDGYVYDGGSKTYTIFDPLVPQRAHLIRYSGLDGLLEKITLNRGLENKKTSSDLFHQKFNDSAVSITATYSLDKTFTWVIACGYSQINVYKLIGNDLFLYRSSNSFLGDNKNEITLKGKFNNQGNQIAVVKLQVLGRRAWGSFSFYGDSTLLQTYSFNQETGDFSNEDELYRHRAFTTEGLGGHNVDIPLLGPYPHLYTGNFISLNYSPNDSILITHSTGGGFGYSYSDFLLDPGSRSRQHRFDVLALELTTKNVLSNFNAPSNDGKWIYTNFSADLLGNGIIRFASSYNRYISNPDEIFRLGKIEIKEYSGPNSFAASGQGTVFPEGLFQYHKFDFSLDEGCGPDFMLSISLDATFFDSLLIEYNGNAEILQVDSLAVKGFKYPLRINNAQKLNIKSTGYSWNGFSQVRQKDLEITRERIKPEPLFSTSDTTGCQWIAYQIQDLSKVVNKGKDVTYHWTFGDGTDSTELNPRTNTRQYKTYSKSGNYKIQLTIDDGYCVDSFSLNNNVKILAAPQPGMLATPLDGCEPVVVDVSYRYGDANDSIAYTWGDGVRSSGATGTEQHTYQLYPAYTTTQEYELVQHLYGPTGCVTTDTASVTVRPGFYSADLPYLRLVTVAESQAIAINWDSFPGATGYYLYRNASLLDTTTRFSYLDETAEIAHNRNEYIVRATNVCDEQTKPSNLGTNILLTGKGSDNNTISVVQWTPYQDWKNGVIDYALQVQNDDGTFTEIYRNGAIAARSYQDQTFMASALSGFSTYKCYRIAAYQKDYPQEISYSNLACVPYKPVIFIPTAFSPNGDNLNDVYRPITFGITQYTMSIYDRYGQKVAELNQDSAGWDAIDYPMGTYMVTLRAKGTDSKWYNAKETVTVVR